MKGKFYIVLLIITVFSYWNATSAEGLKIFNSSGLKRSKVLKIEKKESDALFTLVFSKNLQRTAETVFRVPITYVKNSPLADYYREEPLLVGFLTLLTTMLLGAAGFILYLLGKDPRLC